MYWDRFDIVIAHYLFCCHYHAGQWSALYEWRGELEFIETEEI